METDIRGAVILEVCVESVESAIAADRGGADRIELCSDLLEGGVTPSAGLISIVRSKVSLDLFVLIRPRAADFCYSDEEFQAMEQDVLTAKQLGANGVVLGILNQDGQVDSARTRHMVEIARPLKVTFHRAFDVSSDLSKSLEDVIEAGVDRVLTSGGAQNAEQGARVLHQLNRQAGNRVVVMAGGGLSEKNVRRVIAESGVREVHASIRVSVPSPMRYRNEGISLGKLPGREYQRELVLEENVRRFLAMVNGNKTSDASD